MSFPDSTSCGATSVPSCRVPKVILDGEIVAIDDEGRIDFWSLMRVQGHVHFAAFDILWLNGRDLRHLPLRQRKRRLKRLIPVTTGTLSTIMTLGEHGLQLFQAVCQADFEGIVAKRMADPYSDRTQWFKIKNPTYTQAEGRHELFERRRG